MKGLLDAIVGQDGVRNILKISNMLQGSNEILFAQKSSHLPHIVPQFLLVSIVKFLASNSRSSLALMVSLSPRELVRKWWGSTLRTIGDVLVESRASLHID